MPLTRTLRFIAASAFVLWAAQANSATVTIADTVEPPTAVTVTLDGFVDNGSIDTANEGVLGRFLVYSDPTGDSAGGHFFVKLREPDGSTSDSIEIAIGAKDTDNFRRLDFQFFSDGEAGLTGPCGTFSGVCTEFTLDETGEVTFNSISGLIFIVHSDVETNAVPEPATLALLGLGLAGLGFSRRKQA